MSLRRAVAIGRLELRTHFGSPLFWALLLLAAFFSLAVNPTALIPSGDGAVGGVRPLVNSRYAMAQLFAISGFLLYTFFAAMLAGLSIPRDDEHGISELLHATPLDAAEYVGGKLGGAIAALGAALLFQTLLTVVLFELDIAGAGAPRGPFRLANYLVPALVFAAPGIWCAAALAFVVGERSRRPLAVYAVPTGLFAATLFVFWTWSPPWLPAGVDRLLMVLDPSGLRWLRETLFHVDRGIEFYNRAPLVFDATFLANRLWTLLAPLLAVFASVPHCRAWARGVRRPARNSSGARRPSDLAAGESRLRRSASWASLEMTSTPPRFLASALEIAAAELRQLSRQTGVRLFGFFVVAMTVQVAASASDPSGSPARWTAGNLALDGLLPFTLLTSLLLLFVLIESPARERSSGLEPILRALPYHTGALLLARALVAGALAVVLALASVALSLGLLWVQPGARLELLPFAWIYGLVLPATLLLWTTFVLAAQALLRDRARTYVVGLGALGATALLYQRGAMSWVLDWPLWGTLRWSDFALFDLNGRALALNRATMLAAALFFAAFARHAFARRESDPARRLARLRPPRLARRALALAPFALAPIGLGTFLALEIHGGFQGGAAAARAREYRRQNLATWADFVPPRLDHVDVAVDLEPAARRFEIDGRYTLVNDSGGALDRLPFTVGDSFEPVRWTIAGASAVVESRSGLDVLTLRPPLAQGGSVEIGFAYGARYPRGPTRDGGGLRHFVLPSGVLLSTLRGEFLPVLGFVDDIGVEPGERPEPRPMPEDFWARPPGPRERVSPRFTVRVEATAPDIYTVTSVGEKLDQRSRGGRTTVVYASDVPVPAFNLMAARWERRERGGAVVFHHAAHDENVDEILTTLAAARARYAEWFGPYPWSRLRLCEFPNHDRDATGFATNIAMSESLGFLVRSGSSRLPFEVTAHEAAHQWWPNLVPVRDGPGSGVLIEGMANYATLLLYEAERGPASRIEFARRMEERYLAGRRLDAERPLAGIVESRPGDEATVYDKGAWALWMLHEHLGAERMLDGLRAFAAAARDDPNRSTLHHLLETLRPRAPDPTAYQELVDQWFYRVALPELQLGDARVEPAGARWLVTAEIANVGSGTARLTVAVARGERFLSPTGAPDPGYAEARTTLRLPPGEARPLHWLVDFVPERIVVDPDVRVLQLHRDRAVAQLRPRRTDVAAGDLARRP